MIQSTPGGLMRSFTRILLAVAVAAAATLTSTAPPAHAGGGAVLEVPAAFPTIQAAVDAASSGDTVLIAPGTYTENITVDGKGVTLASHFLTTGDAARIDDTILDGGDGSAVIFVSRTAGGTTVTGLTIQNALDGILAEGPVDITNNHIHDTGDGIDYQRGDATVTVSGVLTDNIIEDNGDDGVDLDNAVAVTIEDNVIQNNDDGGVEVRFDDYMGPLIEVVIRNNVLVGNREDGIQLIDSDEVTDRTVRIEGNIIAGNTAVGIGTMPNGDTLEAFTGGDLEELVVIVNNTVVGNDFGITAGDNMAIVNNIIASNTGTGLKRARLSSIAAHNLIWGNGTNTDDAIVDTATTLVSNPQLDAAYGLLATSPAVDAGVASYQFAGADIIGLGDSEFSGAAPDLGAIEFDWGIQPRFIDVPVTHTFFDEVQWLAIEEITLGCNPAGDRFCPSSSVTRAQMASFLARALNLTASAANPFTDVSGTHAVNIAALAEAGITVGCNADGTLFCPNDPVTRAQMASFLARALMFDPVSADRFADVSGVHAGNINAIAEVGITLGCNADGTLYCPDDPVTRGQMAAFLFRSLST